MPGFQTSVRPVEGVPGACTIRISGRVVLDDAVELREAILGEVARTTATTIVLSLGGVEKMDTAGAAVLIEAVRLGQQRGHKTLLCSPSESVLRMFRLAGLEDVLDCCCPTPEETHRRLVAASTV